MKSDSTTFFIWEILPNSQEGSFASITCPGGDTISAFFLWLITQTLAILSVSVWASRLRFPDVAVMIMVLLLFLSGLALGVSFVAQRLSRTKDCNAEDNKEKES